MELGTRSAQAPRAVLGACLTLCPMVPSTFSFQGSHGNRSFSLGLRTQGTLRRVPRSQLQISKLFLLLLSREQDFPNEQGSAGRGRGLRASEDGWPGRVEAEGGSR